MWRCAEGSCGGVQRWPMLGSPPGGLPSPRMLLGIAARRTAALAALPAAQLDLGSRQQLLCRPPRVAAAVAAAGRPLWPPPQAAAPENWRPWSTMGDAQPPHINWLLAAPPPPRAPLLGNPTLAPPAAVPPGERHLPGGLHRGQAQVCALHQPQRGPLPEAPLPQGAVPHRGEVRRAAGWARGEQRHAWWTAHPAAEHASCGCAGLG